jgi:hypothetical protein
MTEPRSIESDSKEQGSNTSGLLSGIKWKSVFGRYQFTEEGKRQVWVFLAFLSFILFVFLLLLGWPIAPLAFISAVAWYLTGKSKKLVFSAMHEIFLSVTIGLAFFGLFLVYIRISAVSEATLRACEQFFLDFYDGLKKLTDHLIFPVIVAIVTALLMVDRYFKRAHALNRFLALKKFASRLGLTLMVITSFTFFAPNPPGDIAKDFHDRVLNDYKVALGKYKAADMLEHQVEEMSERSANYYRLLFTAISQRGTDANDMSKKAAEDMFNTKLKKLLDNLPAGVKTDASKISDALPTSKDQRDRELNQLHQAETSAENNVTALKEIFSKSLETAAGKIAEKPLSALAEKAIGDLAGEYIGELAGEVGDFLVEKYGNTINLKHITEKIDVFPHNLTDHLSHLKLFDFGEKYADAAAMREPIKAEVDHLAEEPKDVNGEHPQAEQDRKQQEPQKEHIPEPQIPRGSH